MRAIREEDYHGKGIAQEELAEPCDPQEGTAEPDTAGRCWGGESAGSTPAHCVSSAVIMDGDCVRKELDLLNSIESGKRPTEKPKIAKGVGLAKVFRNSPATCVFGWR